MKNLHIISLRGLAGAEDTFCMEMV